MVESDPYQTPSTQDLEDEYIQFIEEHPRFPQRHMRARFPNIDQLKDSQRVARILADKEIKAREQAKKENLQKIYESELLKHKWANLQDQAFQILEKALAGEDVTKEQLDAAKYSLSGKQSYAKRSGELQADKESQSTSSDLPYPKP